MVIVLSGARLRVLEVALIFELVVLHLLDVARIFGRVVIRLLDIVGLGFVALST